MLMAVRQYSAQGWIRALFVNGLAAPLLLPSFCQAQAAGQNRPLKCYELRFGRWSPSLRSQQEGPPSLYHPLPASVQLLDSVMTIRGTDTLYWASRYPADSLRRTAWWARRGPDSLAIYFPSWWSTGIHVSLPRGRDPARGVAQVYVDYTPFAPPTTMVSARVIPCRKQAPS
jgi:hypothetical protein